MCYFSKFGSVICDLLFFDSLSAFSNVFLLCHLMKSASALVIRPPDIVLGVLKFYHNSSFSFFYLLDFISYPSSSLNRTQPKLATCLEVGAI